MVTTGIGHRWGPDRRHAQASLAPPLRAAARWQKVAAGPPLGYPPLVSGGTAFVSWRHGEVAALDVQSASVRWTRALPSAYAAGLPPHEGALLFAGDRLLVRVEDRLLELDPTTGAVRSERAAPAVDLLQGVLSAGAIVSQVSNGDTSDLLAWSVDSGQVLWRRPAEPSLGPPLAASTDRAFAGDGANVLACGLLDGHVHWTAAPGELSGRPGSSASALSIGPDGTLVVGCGSSVLGLDPDSGAVRWIAHLSVNSSSNLSLGFDGRAFVTGLATACEIDTRTGRVREVTLDRAALPPGVAGRYAPAAIAGTHAYVADVSGPVFALSLGSLAVEWSAVSARRRTPADIPVAAAGHLFLLDEAGALECFVAGA